MQDVIAGGLRRAVARDQRVRKQRDRLVGLVGDFVLDREQILVVDRDGAAEFEACAVVPGQRDRLADVERAGALLRPDGVGVRHLDVGVPAADPAELGIERMRRCRTATAARSAAISGRRSRGYFISARSSMRPPLSAIEPCTLAVSTWTRGEAASAARAADRRCRQRPSVPGTAAASGRDWQAWPVSLPARAGRAGRLAAALASAGSAAPAAAACCCFSICGMPKKYCQAISTTAESTMARMVFFCRSSGSRVAACAARMWARRNAPAKSSDHPLERQFERRLPADQHIIVSGR